VYVINGDWRSCARVYVVIGCNEPTYSVTFIHMPLLTFNRNSGRNKQQFDQMQIRGMCSTRVFPGYDVCRGKHCRIGDGEMMGSHRRMHLGVRGM